MFSRQFLTRLSILWIALIVIGSFLPAKSKASLGIVTNSRNVIVRHRVNLRHRAAHFIGFGIAALLLTVLAETRSAKVRACLSIIALGAAIETAQMLLYHAHFESWDLRDDTCAAFVGTLLGAWHIVRLRLLRIDNLSTRGWSQTAIHENSLI